MKITKHLSVDMVSNGVPAVVDVMQGDEGTRSVAVSLYAAGVPWLPPDAAVASVSFIKPDKVSGWYDTLPDETAACTVDGNIVTAVLVPEVTQVAGDVTCVIIFRDEVTLAQLSAFPFTVRVGKNPAAGNTISNPYYKVHNLEQLNAALDGKADRALPTFDLAAMGLPALTLDGTEQTLNGADTAGLQTAAQNGDIFVSVSVNVGAEGALASFKVPMTPVSTAGDTGSEIQGEILFQSQRYLLRVLIGSDWIRATVKAVEAGSSTLTGSGAPTTATKGKVGQLYMDTDTGNLYKCTAVVDGVHTWAELVEKGIPRFDLVYMGLPTVPIGDIGAFCECDTTEIVKAAGYGPISVDVDTAAGRYIVTMNPIISSGAVQLAGVLCMVMGDGSVFPYAASIVLGDGYVRAFITELAAAAALGDISTALDHIIAIQKDIMGIIVFYIDGVAYYADNTGDAPAWPAWLNSTYNILGVYRGSADSCLYTPDGGKIYNSEGVHQTAWANIHDGDVYTIHYEEVAE